MRIAVVGAGAVGSLLGALLALAGHEVTLVGRRGPAGPDTLDVVAPDGARRSVPVGRLAGVAALPGGLDAIVLAVRQFDVPGAVDGLAVPIGTPLVTAQNGVGAEEAVLERRPGAALVALSLTAATELSPGGEVRWLRRGGVGLAPVAGEVGDLVTRLVGAFAAAGLPAVRFEDPVAMKWSKLVANLVGNATSALLDRDPAEIYADPILFDIERRQLREAVDVMRALGVRPVALPGAHVRMLLRGMRLPPVVARPIVARAIGGARGRKSPSLRLHVRGGGTGPTEVRWLNGAVAAAGARSDVPTPVNACLAALVEEAAADPARAAWWAGRPDRLRAAVDAWNAPG